jgi:hypothetical protein
MDELIQFFAKTKLPSLKVNSYFDNYEDLLEKFRGQKITLVEVGVLGGGSLQMWKSYLGKDARIIGVDANPGALKFNNEFEIHIFDQTDLEAWGIFFQTIGLIDVLIDDGGHTSLGQITTCIGAVNNINDGGLIIIEDVHSSYAKDFGMPSKYSFDNWVMQIERELNKIYLDRDNFLNHHQENFLQKVYQITRFRSMVVFKIKKTISKPKSIENFTPLLVNEDFRYKDEHRFKNILRGILLFNPWDVESVGNSRNYLKFLNKLINSKKLKIFSEFYTVLKAPLRLILWLIMKNTISKNRTFFSKF